MHVNILIYIHSLIHTCIHTHTFTLTHTHHTRTHTHTHTLSHTHTYSHTHTHTRRELDGPAARKPGKFQAPFQVILDLEFNQSDGPISPGAAASWQNLPHPRASPLTCFSSHTEEQEVLRQYGRCGVRDQSMGTGQSSRVIT